MSKAAHTHPTTPLRLLDLPPELKVAIAEHVPADAVLPLACTSKECFEAAKAVHTGDLRTTLRSMCASHRLLRWACKGPKPIRLNYKLGCAAARVGNLDVVNWLERHHCFFGRGAVKLAAFHGHIDLLKKWGMRKNKCQTLEGAVCGGQIHILEWLRRLWSIIWWHRQNPYLKAATFGQFDVLEWLYENGCLLDDSTCLAFARNGRLDALMWAVQKGCPWDKQACLFQAEQFGAHGCTGAGLPTAAAPPHTPPSAHTTVINWILNQM